MFPFIMKKIVFDIETKNTFREVGSSAPTALDISLLVIYDYEAGVYQYYLEKDFPKLWKILEGADLLIGYNSDHFDIPILNKYYPGDLTAIRSIDLLLEIKKSIGRRISLENVAQATLGKTKSGYGLQAVEWWKNGEIEKIRKYCEDDVKITKEVYEYALTNGHLKYKDLLTIKEAPLNTSAWDTNDTSFVNYTLPL